MGRVELALPLIGEKNPTLENPFLSAPSLQPQPTPWGRANEEESALSGPDPAPTLEH